jgi:hypothetical protein
MSLSVLNYFFQSGQPLILMPLAIAFLTAADSALWLYWGVVTSFAFLCDLGLKPTLARAYVFTRENRPNSLNAQELNRLSRKIYCGLFALALIGACIFSVITSRNLINNTTAPQLATLATFILCLALAINIACMGQKAKLMGMGHQDIDKISDVLFNVTRTVAVALAIVATQNLLWVSLAYLLSSIVLFVFSSYKANEIQFKNIPERKKTDPPEYSPVKELAMVTGKSSILQISGFIVCNAVGIYIAQNSDPQLVANTLITIRCFAIIQSLSLMPLGVMLPEITRLWLRDEKDKVYGILLALTAMSLTIFVLLAALLYGPGSIVIQHLKDGANLIERTTFFIICTTYFLEVHHVIHATVYMQRNSVPFVLTALISAAVILILGTLYQGDLFALCVIQFSAQLLTNNWYPVYLNLKTLHIKFSQYTRDVIRELFSKRFIKVMHHRIN